MESSTPPNQNQETKDHLQLLGVFYYVVACLALPLLGILLFQSWIIDWVFREASAQGAEDSFEAFVRLAQILIGILAVAHFAAWIYVGRCFRQQNHHTLCTIAAIFVCLSFPLGTVLGVFSLIVLLKPEAKALFGV